MNCQDVRNHLQALYATGGKSNGVNGVSGVMKVSTKPGAGKEASADDAVSKHLVTCAECSAFMDQLDTNTTPLQKVLLSKESATHWLRHEASLRRKLDTADRRSSYARWVWVSGAAAAMLAFSAWAVFSFGQAPHNTVALPAESISNEALASRVATLQESLRNKQLLDEIEQLQISFENAGDAEGKSLAEDAELYVERILSIDVKQPEQVREILAGIQSAGISARFEKLRQSLNDDAPAPLRDSIQQTQTMLSEATQISEVAGGSHANAN